MSSQVSSTVKCVSYHLRNLSRIRQHLDQDTCKLAVQALVFSRIDYGNALLFGSTEYDVTRLQRLQNRAARLIYLVGRDTPSVPLLRRLHWLPIRKRIEFKLLVIIYKCINSQAPQYLQELITYHRPKYATRSSLDTTLLSVPKNPKIKHFKSQVHVCGTLFHPASGRPRLWTFSGITVLKTHLFN